MHLLGLLRSAKETVIRTTIVHLASSAFSEDLTQLYQDALEVSMTLAAPTTASEPLIPAQGQRHDPTGNRLPDQHLDPTHTPHQ